MEKLHRKFLIFQNNEQVNEFLKLPQVWILILMSQFEFGTQTSLREIEPLIAFLCSMFSWKLITSECVEQEIKYICYMFRTQENYLSSPLTLSCIQKCTTDSQSRLWTEMPSSDLVTLSFGICRRILFTYCKSNLLSCKHHQLYLFPRVQSKLVHNFLSHFGFFLMKVVKSYIQY